MMVSSAMGLVGVLALSVFGSFGKAQNVILNETALEPGVNATRNNPPLPGIDRISQWLALGDSFSAGPGAGDPYDATDPNDCRRNKGAYGPQMEDDYFFQSPNGYDNPIFQFQSCTGDKIPQVIDNQLSFVRPQTELITLSIGGNDIGFAKILQNCVAVGLSSCSDTLARSRGLLYSQDLFFEYLDMIDGITGNTRWSQRNENTIPAKRTLIYQTSYPPFFDSWTTQCNNVKFSIVPGTRIGVRLTTDLRSSLNQLGQELNAVLAYWIDLVNYDEAQNNPSLKYTDLIKFADQDQRYNGHRFCTEGVTEPDRNNPNTFFFNFGSNAEKSGDVSEAALVTEAQIVNSGVLNNTDPATCLDVPQGPTELLQPVECALAVLLSNNSDPQNSSALWPNVLVPESVQKSFHPKINGFSETKDQILQALSYRLPSNYDGPPAERFLRIMCIGDEMSGSGNNNQAYRYQLFRLLTDNAPIPGVLRPVVFVGSNSNGRDPWGRNEAFPGTINQISDQIPDDAPASSRANVVIIMAGTQDLENLSTDDDAGLQQVVDDLEALITKVHNSRSSIAILVAQLPPIGSATPGDTVNAVWPPSAKQEQVIKFNAMVSNLVNQLQTQSGYNVLKVHTTPTLYDNAGNGALAGTGYSRLAYDFEEAIYNADYLGMISGRTYAAFNGTNVTGLPSTDTIVSSAPTGTGSSTAKVRRSILLR